MSLNKFLGLNEEGELPPDNEAGEAAAPEPEGREGDAGAPPEPQGEPGGEPAAGEAGGEGEGVEGDDRPQHWRALRSTVETVKRERNDYKGQAERVAGELAAERRERERVQAELEALRKGQTAAPPPAQAAPTFEQTPPPNPVEDPEGYQLHFQRILFNERLNNSEAMLRSQVSDEDVDAKMAVFKKAADANPSLRFELQRQAHPWRWAYQQAQRMMAMDEIGPDPAAYKAKTEGELRARIEAEVRAKVEEELRGAAPVVATHAQPRQQPNIPSSLGTARSAAPRLPSVEAIPTMEDVFGRNRNRR